MVGVRIPNHDIALKILNKVKKPLLVPSANKSGEPPLSLYQDVYSKFNGDISAIVKKDANGELPSTIVSISDRITLIREGSIPFSDIENIWRNK